MSTGFPSFTDLVTKSMNSTRFVAQERPGMKPCSDFLIKLFSKRWLITRSLIIDSSILHGTLVRETGL